MRERSPLKMRDGDPSRFKNEGHLSSEDEWLIFFVCQERSTFWRRVCRGVQDH